jgi:uncharacterized protein YacL
MSQDVGKLRCRTTQVPLYIEKFLISVIKVFIQILFFYNVFSKTEISLLSTLINNRIKIPNKLNQNNRVAMSPIIVDSQSSMIGWM